MGKNVWGLYVCFLKSKSIQVKKRPRLPYLPLLKGYQTFTEKHNRAIKHSIITSLSSTNRINETTFRELLFLSTGNINN